ncbi:MAG: hypothetical protein H7305_14870 [Gemmatimonadaceae bacterium]|nr:hypothetical protein [Gemmatimonadaceae bacterium]
MTLTSRISPVLSCLAMVTVVAGCASKVPATSTAPTPSGTTAAPASAGAAASATSSIAGPGVALPAPSGRTDRQLLTRDEMRKTEFTNLYDVIRVLRGNWIRVRAAESFGKSAELQVYLDMQRIGTIEELRTMSPMNILTVRFFDSIQASARWGMDHGAGALLITTSKR